ncbi:hypothetical protein E1B28_009562 [Marasmius oreades]|uniref:Biotrophy-associated secreted protein 2 n=1 Tax=Marasmius oreades TaxID=181124 RepID=A0A9P7RVB3_9AGAR|nr:uncharacterized protein E1B28_009562 [Marasmius oreades]KAG7090444.1 hypothetical protein E1B28_009562 [Marasmius oreades]
MAKFTLLLTLLSVNLASAFYVPRAAPGTQFITGPCSVDAECASGCCAFNTGKCAGAVIALTRDGGCGHGNGQSNSRAAGVLRGNCPGTSVKRDVDEAVAISPRTPLSPDAAGVVHIGNGRGEQFITGQCLSNADCASGCCATLGEIDICSGPAVANEQGKSGCGFSGSGTPPATNKAVNPESQNNQEETSSPPPSAPFDGPATAGNAGIGANCGRDSDCTTACCGFNTGKCALAKFAPGSDGGCGRGEGAPNNKAANVINGNAPIC